MMRAAEAAPEETMITEIPDWPKDDAALARLFGCAPGSIGRHRAALLKAGTLIDRTDYTPGIPGSRYNRCLWHPSGAEKVAMHCRAAGAKRFLAARGVATSRASRIESNTVGTIMAALEDLIPCQRQYTVNGYKVDLYLPTVRLAIECDEHGHKSYARLKEIVRQVCIEVTQACTFLRYDPYAPDFDIGTIINKILKHIRAQNTTS
jgi:very-short-patch-repair endonuclease